MKWRRRCVLPPPEHAVQGRNARPRRPHIHAIHTGSKILPVAPQALHPRSGNVRLEYRTVQNQKVNATRTMSTMKAISTGDLQNRVKGSGRRHRTRGRENRCCVRSYPGRDSNPQLSAFEAGSSANWDTRAGGSPIYRRKSTHQPDGNQCTSNRCAAMGLPRHEVITPHRRRRLPLRTVVPS